MKSDHLKEVVPLKTVATKRRKLLHQAGLVNLGGGLLQILLAWKF